LWGKPGSCAVAVEGLLTAQLRPAMAWQLCGGSAPIPAIHIIRDPVSASDAKETKTGLR
jgi:hypothetical protein